LTVNDLEIENVRDPDFDFEDILKMSRGQSIEVTSSSVLTLLDICGSIVNRELSEVLIDFWIGDAKMSKSNVIERLLMKRLHSTSISSEIDFIASHLSDFDSSVLKVLDSEVMDEIISSSSIRIENEDFLLDLIVSLGHLNLLCRIQCAFLSVSGIDRLLGCVSLSSINSELWTSLCDRLRCSVEVRRVNLRRYDWSRLFEYEGNRFSGILSHLSSICGGNVHDQGEVEIRCSSATPSYLCPRVADFTGKGYWASQPTPNSWICIDFKTRRVQLDHYSLKGPTSGCYPTDWVIEGSNDNSVWVILDERHTDSLIGCGRIETFGCSRSTSNQQFRQIRWRMTDEGKDNPGEKRCCHTAKLCNIEFFGSLFSIPD
jgi:hypothetical protein